MSTVVLCHEEGVNLSGLTSHNARVLQYSITISFDDLKSKIMQYSATKIRNLGLHIQCRDKRIMLVNSREGEVCRKTLTSRESAVFGFFKWLVTEILTEGAFIDFLLTTPIEESPQLCLSLQTISWKKISVRFVSRFLAFDLAPHNRRIVDVYVELAKMKSSSGVRASSATNRYERIRTVGKGAFGSAVLYRRKDDNSLVIIKEINMYDLDSTQRQLALNEVSLLSRIEHPNIIAYYDSFEEDGLLMIEMEYADGGTLAQMLSRSESFLSEDTIVEMMLQMLSAVSYLHDNAVLHRDLKTANVFLTKDAFVKIGDFGISKIMGTDTLAQGAKTVVGTPYYISPEMCSGNSYNEKSDMWALGCILYEMCCLKKAFEGDNLPALVNNIMTCSYTPVKGPFSAELKLLVRELLQLDPQNRPSAASALKMLRPSEARKTQHSSSLRLASATCTSSLYILHTGTISLSVLPKMPSRISIKQVAVSETHTLMLTNDNLVYSWGENKYGQLGTGTTESSEIPKIVELLKGRDIQSVSCGNGFSVICCDRGTLLAFGKGSNVGMGQKIGDVSRPTLLEHLLRDHIKEVICGFDHVVALTEGGECYVWGDGRDGKLGTGRMDHVYAPTKISVPSNKKIVWGRAGRDATILLCDDGSLVACGSNRNNKLNLAHRQGFFSKEKHDSELVSKLTAMKGFPERVADFHLGSYHTGVIMESGQLILFGRNDFGELGHGHAQPIPIGCLKPVKSLLQHACTNVLCGDGFTLVATTEGELYFWGKKECASEVRSSLGVANNSITLEDLESTREICVFEDQRPCRTSRHDHIANYIVPLPSLILRLHDSSGRYSKGIRLSSMVAAGKKVFVVVDSCDGKRLPSALERTRTGSLPTLDDDTMVRTWLRDEIDNAEVIPIDPAKRKFRIGSSSDEKNKLNSSDSALLREIESLKVKIKEQNTTFAGHQLQMTDLQSKLLELQARQALLHKSEPPPAYDKRSVPYNNLFPENTSRACTIL